MLRPYNSGYPHDIKSIGRRFSGRDRQRDAKCSPQDLAESMCMQHPHIGNRLLDSLAADDLQLLLPHLTEISFTQKQTFNSPGGVIEHIYFPTAGVVSLVTLIDEGASVEIAVGGWEGLLATPVCLASETASHEAY